jgi:hypothetical protein
MKTINSNFAGKLKSSLLVLAIAVISFNTVQASTATGAPVNEVTLTSLGVVSGEMIFKLKYDNVNGDNLEVVLTDKEGNRLYRQVFTDKSLNRTFKVPSEVESFVVRFTNLRTKEEQKFEVKTQVRTVEEVSVSSVR